MSAEAGQWPPGPPAWMKDIVPCWPPQEANPHRVGACPDCGAYRTDGRWPYIHKPGCQHEGDLQLDRLRVSRETGDHGGAPLYCTEHDHTLKRTRA